MGKDSGAATVAGVTDVTEATEGMLTSGAEPRRGPACLTPLAARNPMPTPTAKAAMAAMADFFFIPIYLNG